MDKFRALLTPANIRLAAYAAAAIVGAVMVATSAVEAANLGAWIDSTANQLAIVLTAVSGLAAGNVHQRPAEIDPGAVAEAVVPAIIEHLETPVPRDDRTDRSVSYDPAINVQGVSIDARKRAADRLASLREQVGRGE